MRIIKKVCQHCKNQFLASCGKEAFCSDKCQILENVKHGSGGCWNWTKSKDKDGYGYAKLKGGKTVKAHRAAYTILVGNIGAGLMVCHKCDNPSCCNPAHLFLGTAKDNKTDCVSKGRDFSGRGENHHKAKLTERDVVSILESDKSAPELAKIYGVHRNMIYAIRKGENWKHIKRKKVSYSKVSTSI